MRVFPPGDNSFMIWLTREEWQVCFAVGFAYEAEGLSDECETLGEQFRWILAHLQRAYGYTWHGLRVDNEGELWATVDDPVCEENTLWLVMLHKGEVPDYRVHLPAAIEYLEQKLPGFDLEPLREALRRVERSVALIREMAGDAPKEVREQLREELELRRRALSGLGPTDFT